MRSVAARKRRALPGAADPAVLSAWQRDAASVGRNAATRLGGVPGERDRWARRARAVSLIFERDPGAAARFDQSPAKPRQLELAQIDLRVLLIVVDRARDDAVQRGCVLPLAGTGAVAVDHRVRELL